jgi:AAA15 family ATPase/GTPase
MKLTSILLDGAITSDYTTTETDNALANLSKINIFIGANNSGKSRLMRTLFTNETFKYLRLGVRSDELIENLKNFHHAVIGGMKTYISSDAESIPELLKEKGYLNKNGETGLEKWFIPNGSFFNFNVLKMDKSVTAIQSTTSYINSFDYYQSHCINSRNELKEENTPFFKTYIPILRGLRPIHSSSSDHVSFSKQNDYVHRTMFDYFKAEKEANKLSISTGLDFYDQLNRLKNGDPDKRDLVKDFEAFLGETFFQNKTIVITPHIDKDVVTFMIDEGKERPIYDLGDGIQAIILLTYPLFFNKGKEMIFFFEEPEIYLHPGFQRIFIDTLLSKRFESFQYFFTTHSHHFLDITLDHNNISIYNFRQQKSSVDKFDIENVQSGDISLLEELGVRNASVFLSNCTIWVEGITDRIYIRKYLEMLMDTKGSSFREDYHYSFVEYGGNNITHWSFLDDDDANHANINVDRICKRIFVVTDQDGAGEVKDGGRVDKEKKQKRQKQLKAKLGDSNYHCLDCREIENALAPHILKQVIETWRDKRLKENKPITYIGNWSYEQYQHKELGRFIEKNLSDDSKKMLKTISDGGTINDKPECAKTAVNAIKSFDDLSEPAKNLTKQIYAFIKKSNE